MNSVNQIAHLKEILLGMERDLKAFLVYVEAYPASQK